MKNIHVLSFLLLIAIFSSCKKKYDIIELPRIEYDVLINNYGSHYSWFDHVEGFQRLELFQMIIDNVKTGNFKIEDMQGKSIPVDRIEEMMTILILEDTTQTEVFLNSELLNGIRFRESWSVNSGTGFIEKKVEAFCPLFFISHPFIDGNTISTVYPLFWIYPVEGKRNTDNEIVVSKISFDVVIDNTLFFVSESYGQQLPFYFMNIEPPIKSLITNALLDAGLEKRTPTYDYFFTEMTDKDLENIEYKTDTLIFIDPENPQIMHDSIIERVLDRNSIHRIKFIEEWSIDKTTLQFHKTVIAVCPSSISYDEYGEYKGFKFLFWLLFDKQKKSEMVFQ
jgi:hypothetical protein